MTTTDETSPIPTSEAEQAASAGCAAMPGSALLVLPLDTPADCVAELRAAGYLPLLTGNPNGVRIITGECAVASSDMLMAAMKALNIEAANMERRTFIAELYKRMLDREQNA